MNILLINPSGSYVYGKPLPLPYPPLGMLYIAAVLEQEHRVEVCDYDVDIMNEKNFESTLQRFRPDAVAMTANTLTVTHARRLATIVKRHGNIPVILGGLHATMMPEECIAYPEFDFIVKGEAEHTILNLVNNLQCPSEVPGVWYKRNGKIIRNKEAPFIQDLDSLPFPARHLIKNREAYVPADAERLPVTPIMTSRGCAARCTFCCTKYILGFRFRYRTAASIVKEIEECVDRYGVKEFHVADDVFTFNKTRVMEFRDLVLQSGLDVGFHFLNGLRADQIDRDILQALRDIGVTTIGFGVESGSQRILNNIRKGESLATIRKAYALARGMGFQTWAFFIFGLPGETKETIKETIRFARSIDPDFPKFHILKPYPGSEIFNELMEKGLIDDFNYERYGIHTAPVHHLEELSAQDILKAQKQAYRQFYLRPRTIAKRLSRIRSPTQLKLNLQSARFVLHQMRRNQ